jgi:pSer/pThr/pTyr-binding forkhead associated (FHA) protein
MNAKLIPLTGGEPIELPREMVIVGRREDCDVKLEHKSVSKQHCVLVKTNGLVMLRDLGSTNGTRVNGQRVRRAALVPDDTVSFANVRYRLAINRAESGPMNSQTQQMAPEELDQIMGRLTQINLPDLDAEPPEIEVKTNDLPDKYTEEPGTKH